MLLKTEDADDTDADTALTLATRVQRTDVEQVMACQTSDLAT
jgi:hypothetical protein